MTAPALKFALPPSLGSEMAERRAREFEQLLTRELGRPVEVVVSPAYESLAKDLLSGDVDAAWAPPFVCARVEALGARILLRGVRRGASTYRAALVCRHDVSLTLQGLTGKKVAWVDQDAIAGYLLPVAFLKSQGIDPAKTFVSQTYAGSYRAALEAVAEGRADLTSVFAPLASHDKEERTGILEVAPELASRFRVVAFTEESPNDGVAVSMTVDAKTVANLERVLLDLRHSEEGRALLQHVFGADAFEPAPRMGYRALYRVALASL